MFMLRVGLDVVVLERRQRRAMVGDEQCAPTIRRGGVFRSLAPRRVPFGSTQCSVDLTGVTLYRWLTRSVFIPLELVDRFAVVFTQGEMPGDVFEHLVLFTRDGLPFPIKKTVMQWLSGSRGLSRGAIAQQLNNLILEKRRAAPVVGGGGHDDRR
jgi:hypothetical protein